MEKTIVESCATIVTAQLQHQRMTAEEIVDSIRTVFGALDALHRTDYQPHPSTGQAAGMPDRLSALRQEPEQSLQKQSVTCLECGKEFRLLSNRHVALHSLTPRAYKRKWGIPLTTALSARTLTARRRKLAKEMGMGKELAQWRATHRQVTA